MKKTVFCFAMLFTFLAPSANAASGAAIVPHWGTAQWSNTSTKVHRRHTVLFLSNIIDSSVKVTVTLFGDSGAIFTDDNNRSAGTITASGSNLSSYEEPTNATATFVLGPKSTMTLYLISSNPTFEYGYGTIVWTQESNAPFALVGWGKAGVDYLDLNVPDGRASEASIQINEGKPF